VRVNESGGFFIHFGDRDLIRLVSFQKPLGFAMLWGVLGLSIAMTVSRVGVAGHLKRFERTHKTTSIEA
jgi:hypothetical protein